MYTRMPPTAPITNANQLGAYVRAMRKARGLTQTDVAKMLGVTKMRVATIEKDIGRVSTSSVIELLHLLGGSISLEIPGLPDRTQTKSEQTKTAGTEVRDKRPRGEW